MLTFVRNWSWEIALGLLGVVALSVVLSVSTNRQVSYAPCLAKVVAGLREDPAAVRFQKLATEPLIELPQGCDVAEDVARKANRALTDLLLSDNTLYERLPRLLNQAGMDCTADERSIVCDCRAEGPFAIANPCADCSTLVDLPLPLKRALIVGVNKHPAVRKGKTVEPGKYVVELQYATTLFEVEKPEPTKSAALISHEVIEGGVYGW